MSEGDAKIRFSNLSKVFSFLSGGDTVKGKVTFGGHTYEIKVPKKLAKDSQALIALFSKLKDDKKATSLMNAWSSLCIDKETSKEQYNISIVSKYGTNEKYDLKIRLRSFRIIDSNANSTNETFAAVPAGNLSDLKQVSSSTPQGEFTNGASSIDSKSASYNPEGTAETFAPSRVPTDEVIANEVTANEVTAKKDQPTNNEESPYTELPASAFLTKEGLAAKIAELKISLSEKTGEIEKENIQTQIESLIKEKKKMDSK